MYMQFGCGWTAPASWINFDASPTLRFERLPVLGRLYTKNAQRFPGNVQYGDIVAGLPIPANSCDGIFSSHVIEHLARSDADAALKNTLRYLRPGGTFRLVVPDLRQLAGAYLADASVDSAHRFMQEACLGQEHRPAGILGVARQFIGKSAHLWMWDEGSLSTALADHGFGDIRRARFGDAEDPMFSHVENRDRFEGCLALQCRKL